MTEAKFKISGSVYSNHFSGAERFLKGEVSVGRGHPTLGNLTGIRLSDCDIIPNERKDGVAEKGVLLQPIRLRNGRQHETKLGIQVPVEDIPALIDALKQYL